MITRLLVADSDASLADIYRRYFSKHGYEVGIASSGLECLDEILGADVLILEFELLWGGGDGVLARMREEPLMPEIPVVLVSDKTNHHWPAMLTPPVVECVRRPFRFATLLEAVRAAGLREMPSTYAARYTPGTYN